jgi:hypothetical protein
MAYHVAHGYHLVLRNSVVLILREFLYGHAVDGLRFS